MSARVLLLGGTGEARRLAALLARRDDVDVVSSLAGRVAAPSLPEGRTRVGGFGGPDGLAAWLAAERIDAVVDATHPFAARITDAAVTATARAGLPLLILRRPGWTERPGDDWHRVPSLAAAADPPGDRVFLTTGRDGLPVFAGDDRRWFLVRCVDPPPPPLPPRSTVLLARGPYTVEGELELFRRHALDVLVTKDSGGEMTAAKLTAARMLGVPVVMVDRPPMPEAPAVATAEAAEAWLARLAQAAPGIGSGHGCGHGERFMPPDGR